MTPFILNDATGNYHADGNLTADQIIEQAQMILCQALQSTISSPLTEPSKVRQLLRLKLADKHREVFACLFLDNQHRLISYDELFQGTIDSANVYPREVVKAALLHNAAAVILAHNHPSGHNEPSEADKQITKRLKDALALVDIRVLDHFVIGHNEPVSFAERGLL